MLCMSVLSTVLNFCFLVYMPWPLLGSGSNPMFCVQASTLAKLRASWKTVTAR